MKKCGICGNEHDFKCPLIKSFEYYEDSGNVKRTEFVTCADFAYEVIKDELEELDPHGTVQ